MRPGIVLLLPKSGRPELASLAIKAIVSGECLQPHSTNAVADELSDSFSDLPDWAKTAVMGHLTREFPAANPEQIGKALSQAATSTGPTCNLAAWLANAGMLLREAKAV